jgi:hypothetical protein
MSINVIGMFFFFTKSFLFFLCELCLGFTKVRSFFNVQKNFCKCIYKSLVKEVFTSVTKIESTIPLMSPLLTNLTLLD